MIWRWMARRLALMSFKYGVTLKLVRGVKSVLPERPLSLAEREEAMEKNMARYSGGWLVYGLFSLYKANRVYAAREALLTVMRSDALEVERSEALVSLLRRDLDAHPLFTKVAAAEDVAAIRAALAEVDRPTVTRKVKFLKRAGKSEVLADGRKAGFAERAWALVGGQV